MKRQATWFMERITAIRGEICCNDGSINPMSKILKLLNKGGVSTWICLAGWTHRSANGKFAYFLNI